MPFDPGKVSKADAVAYTSSSSSDEVDEDEYLHPSVDPRADEFIDLNPRKRRRTGRNTKESAALGIFGSESEDEGHAGRRRSKKDLRHKTVAFVSAGKGVPKQDFVDANKEEKNGYDDEEDDDGDQDALSSHPGLGKKLYTRPQISVQYEDEGNEDEDEDEDMTGVGLGFGSSAQGPGLAPPARPLLVPVFGEVSSKPSKIQPAYDGSTSLGKAFVPSSTNEPILKSNLTDGPSSVLQTPKPGGGGKAKLFAAQMMKKWGYVEGQGLGAQGQGRKTHVEATLRPQGVGLGAVKEKSGQERKEEKRQARMRGEEVVDSDEENKRRKRERKRDKGLGSLAGSGASTPRKSKTRYLTVTDIQKAAPGLHIPDAFAPILDLTGRDQKLLTSGSGLLTPSASTEVSEQTGAWRLAKRAQGDLAAFVEEWKGLQERNAWLSMEETRRRQELNELEGEFSSLGVFSSVLAGVGQAARDRDWDRVIFGLKKVEPTISTHGDEELASIAVSVIHPFLKDAVQGWHPLEDPNLGNFASDLLRIRGVLGLKFKDHNENAITKWQDVEIDSTHRHHIRSTTPWESMIYQILFPRLVTAISQTWDVHDAAPLVTVFDRWQQLLPDFVRSQLLAQVVKRLESAINNWKPKRRHEILHFWLFPWLQHLPVHHLEPKGAGLVGEVRRKFRQVIDTWDFSKGVVPGLEEWKDMFRPTKAQDQWKPLVMYHVLPSMGRYLRTNFRVDPSDQEPYLDMVNGVLKWTDVISASMVGEVIVSEVFPLWHDVLYQWLTSEDPNYDEIGAWYEWWKDQVLPFEVSSLPSVVNEFDKGTAMIHLALDLGINAKSQLPRPDGQAARRAKSHSHKPKTERKPELARIPPQLPEKAEPTFRDEVEDWCQENDLQFIPVRKVNEEGKHYFRITARLDGKGGVLSYFRGGNTLVVESRKMNLELRGDMKEDWGLLIESLYQEVEQGGKG
ncbi:TFP11-domain-containing protein [Hypoxylon sp. NC1633]|nr:TFP11-domain-containing protein [Hypoxylon sp. NC1633]